MTPTDRPDRPLPSFTAFSSMAVVVGIVVGTGIFRLPPLVAANSSGEVQFLLFWIAGGVISLLGALCWAELSSSHPDAGGEYYFLRRAFGPGTGFFLSWGRMTVIQTGSIALVAFILGEFAGRLFDLGPHGPSIYAAAAIVLLTGLNILGTVHSRRAQNCLAAAIAGVLLVLAAGALLRPPAGEAGGLTLTGTGGEPASFGAAGLALIFVLFTYGGWSEAAYLTGELKNVRRSILQALIAGIAVITALYLLINLAYLHQLGFAGLRTADAVGADLAQAVFGRTAADILSVIVILAGLSTANATILTGSRTNYALGRDFRLLGFMGKWNARRNTPVRALLVQGAIALALVAGARTERGLETVIAYTAPVFWFFILLITAALFVFRLKGDLAPGAYRLPLFPLPPLLFMAAVAYLLYSSLAYAGTGALAGAAVLLAGVPVYLLARR